MPSILLVEDADDVRDVIALALTDAGHQVAVATEFASALAILAREAPDLVITNVVLPGGNSRGLAQAAGAQRIPVLYITGDFAHMARLEAEGACLLRKPFRLQELHDAVALACGPAAGTAA
jgi:DNA-binding response OmpR family regulator